MLNNDVYVYTVQYTHAPHSMQCSEIEACLDTRTLEGAAPVLKNDEPFNEYLDDVAIVAAAALHLLYPIHIWPV